MPSLGSAAAQPLEVHNEMNKELLTAPPMHTSVMVEDNAVIETCRPSYVRLFDPIALANRGVPTR